MGHPTNDKPETAIIIKSNRNGRPRYGPAYREEVLDGYESSGMSGPAFARHCVPQQLRPKTSQMAGLPSGSLAYPYWV